MRTQDVPGRQLDQGLVFQRTPPQEEPGLPDEATENRMSYRGIIVILVAAAQLIWWMWGFHKMGWRFPDRIGTERSDD